MTTKHRSSATANFSRRQETAVEAKIIWPQFPLLCARTLASSRLRSDSSRTMFPIQLRSTMQRLPHSSMAVIKENSMQETRLVSSSLECKTRLCRLMARDISAMQPTSLVTRLLTILQDSLQAQSTRLTKQRSLEKKDPSQDIRSKLDKLHRSLLM